MNGAFNLFADPKRVDNEIFSTHRDDAMSRGLHIHHDEYETVFDEDLTLHSTPSELINMFLHFISSE